MTVERNCLLHGKENQTSNKCALELTISREFKNTTHGHVITVLPCTDPLICLPTKLLGIIPDVPETNFLVEMSTHYTLLCADNIIAAGSCKHCLYA